uniref:GUN4-like domain-containing protein n=2 Tax=Gelidium TaxID=2811 RepID=A0A411FSY8_9FLOR|nr:hypothetical protein [Gelidium coulteri]YP_009565293.1 hypothetical protein [Gelidium sinicola]QBA96244.1 hypothetical protein [Gelidium coulteri]QBA96644.1 hypothetical protein [Gelidium sinicola]
MTDIIEKNQRILNKLVNIKSRGFNSFNEQLKLINQIIDDGSEDLLVDLLIKKCIFNKESPDYLDGIIFEILRKLDNQSVLNKLDSYFQDGLIEFQSSLRIDYQPLQDMLMLQSFKEADKLTQSYLCKLAGLNDFSERNWLYFTDIFMLPSEDLSTIDMLWRLYSRGKFGFSIQRKIWLSNENNWEIFWNKIQWKDSGIPRRYPDDFIWNINAPEGHLPLFNQLRGVQVLSALFNHPAWDIE